MQHLKSQILYALPGKRDQYILYVGLFAAVCVGADLVASCAGQLLGARLLNAATLVVLSAGAFYAGSVSGRPPQNAGAGKARGFPVRKVVWDVPRDGEHNRQASKRPDRAKAAAPMRPEVRDALYAAFDDIDTAPPEVDREAAAPRHASRGPPAAAAGAHAEGEGIAGEPVGGQPETDAHAVGEAGPEGVEPGASAYPALVLECVKSGDAGTALRLFDQIMEAHADYDHKWAHSMTIPQKAHSRFFELVAGQLDDERLRKDGLRILAAVREHGVQPPYVLQNRLIRAWESKLPEQVLYCLRTMQEDGLALSPTARRRVIADMAGSAQEGGTTSAYSGGWPLLGHSGSGEPQLVLPADVSIGQNEPTYDAAEETPAAEEPEPGASHAAAERTTLRAEASTFVPNCLGPAPPSILSGWVPQQGEFPKMAMQHIGSLHAAQLCPPPGLHDELPQMAMHQMGSRCDECTTMMLRNLPCNFLREDLIQQMDKLGFAGLYNLVYMPIDFKTAVGMGYAFVN